MTVTATIVPTLTRADLLLIEQWNAQQQRTRDAYRDNPFAGSLMGAGTCRRCKDRDHRRCTSQARNTGGVTGMCRCFAGDHETRRTR
jgi:hypothetical protein